MIHIGGTSAGCGQGQSGGAGRPGWQGGGVIPAFSVAKTRAAEKKALERVGDDRLMRRAAFEIAQVAIEMLSQSGGVSGRRALLLVGSGNNGGDALFAGALLRRRGVAVTAILTDPAKRHPAGLAALRARGGRVVSDARSEFDRADIIIDGLVGLAGTPPLRDSAAVLVEQANRAPAGRIAVDLPSGIDPDTGRTDGPAFAADVTVTFGGAKPGLLLAEQAGRVVIAELEMAPGAANADALVLTDADVADLLPDPGAQADKYSGGVPGIVAGSKNYPGAALLCVGGAVRLRPGMVRYAGPQAAAVVVQWPEVVAADEPDQAGTVQAWVVGPGMGTDDAALVRLRTVLEADQPTVIDADALTLLSKHPDLLELRRGRPTVLTPHAGEFARLFPDLDLEDRLGAVRAAASDAGVTVLLKGRRTLICPPRGPVAVNTTGTGWLATAGSGDVLSGVIGSFLASGIEPWQAAAAGAHLHGRAGERADRDAVMGATALWDRLR